MNIEKSEANESSLDEQENNPSTQIKPPAVSDNLFTPLEKPEISGNLISDPHILNILQLPELRQDV